MKQFFKKIFFSLSFILLLVSCQSDETDSSITPENAEMKVLFSVNFGNSYTQSIKGYLAAYTPEGELLNFGSLNDSLKWDLKAKYAGDKIDILFFQVAHESSVSINHIKNVNIGETFTKLQNIIPYQETVKTFKLKVEDFGKRKDNGTAETGFQSTAYIGRSGYATFNQFGWGKIENGYTYEDLKFGVGNNPKETEFGAQLLLFERGTNKPYLKYFDLKTLTQNNNDVITLNKSDFSPAEVKNIQVSAKDDTYSNMFLYTYNSKTDRRDIIRSFNQIIEGDKIWYVSSNDEMPIDYWSFIYVANNDKTGYIINSNKKEIPSNVSVKELTDYKIIKSGQGYSFTHTPAFAGKNLIESYVSLHKNIYSGTSIDYYFNLNASESTGTIKLQPFKIPSKLLDKYEKIKETNKLEFTTVWYSQTYNTKASFALSLQDRLFGKDTKIGFSENEYTEEIFNVKLSL